ncbi:hypothetical protein EBB07_30230 [Paenibacillaceae bacterium]|nr:hypothetical protein EBB07_30230 [Paenibacillaceae bacterium]
MKKTYVVFVILFSLVLIVGCSAQNNKNTPEVTQTKQNNQLTPLSEQITIDTSEYTDNVAYKPIITELKKNLAAWVELDRENFSEGFITAESAEQHYFLLAPPFNNLHFQGKITIVEFDDNPDRVDVNVQYKEQSNNEERSYTYNFGKNEQGEWKITQID